MHHNLKIQPKYFEAVKAGTKTFEIRENDRNFVEGDTVELQEWDGRYTGRVSPVYRVGYVTDYAQQDNHVVFSLLPAGGELNTAHSPT